MSDQKSGHVTVLQYPDPTAMTLFLSLERFGGAPLGHDPMAASIVVTDVVLDFLDARFAELDELKEKTDAAYIKRGIVYYDRNCKLVSWTRDFVLNRVLKFERESRIEFVQGVVADFERFDYDDGTLYVTTDGAMWEFRHQGTFYRTPYVGLQLLGTVKRILRA